MRNEEFAACGQMLGREDQELVDLIYNRLDIWRDGCKEIHDRARVARKILLLQDPGQDPENVKPERKTLQLQTLKSTFNNCVADQTDNVMDAKMLPETPELQAVADDLNDIVRCIYEKNDYPAMHRQRVQDYMCTGTAITEIMWDKDASHGKGEIAFVRVPVEEFLWDPAAADIKDARALMRVSWHPLSWYREHYPDVGMYVQADEHSANAVGERENQEQLAADEEKAMMIEYWWRTYDAKTKRYRINMANVAGRALIEKHENVYDHGDYPFNLDVFTEIEGLPVGDGLVMELVPMMRYINRYAKYMDENIRRSSKPKALIRRGANIDVEQLADWDQEFVECDDIGPDGLGWLETPQLTTLALNQMLQMMTDLKQDSGQNQFTRGETAGGVTAATAIVSLQEAGGKQTRMRTETLKRGFKRITEQVLWLISQFYDEDRVMMITGKQNDQRMVEASPKHLFGKEHSVLPAPPYTVRVQVERMNPNAISEQNQMIIDAYKMSAEAGNPFPLTALFSILNVDGKDRILPILSSVEQQAAIMQQLAAENEQLKAENAQMSESINGMKEDTLKYAKQTLSTSASKNPDKLSQGLPQPTM